MDTFTRFLYEFLSQFFLGIKTIFIGLIEGVKTIFNVNTYIKIIESYKQDFSGPEWVLVAVGILMLAAVVAIVAAIIIILVRKYLKFRRRVADEEELLIQVNKLNDEVTDLIKEKEELLSMVVAQKGLQPAGAVAGGGDLELEESNFEEGEEDSDFDPEVDSRFSKLTEVDQEYAKYKQKDYKNNFDLPQFCRDFRNFAAYKLNLYYSPQMIRLFVSAIASTKLVILQGISGTGKTSIALAWGKFMKHPSCVASVQPSWRDRTDIFGYLNEFTKKFNETDFLRYLYTAGYTDEVYTVILDEMNLARVEYYFAEMLSILEMHDQKEWKVEVVQSSWKTDPKKLIGGKLQIPPNAWYIGTINNDDSTFMVTDKVYDRAMPLDLNEKGIAFEPEPTEALDINYSYLDNLFQKAMQEHKMSDETLNKIEEMDDYTIKHFRVAFGNRIVKHMKKFVPVYVACGGDEIEAVDYFMAKKVLRKFESLNLSLIRDEINPYIEFLDKTFGKGAMKECTEFLLRLKKS